MKKNYSLYGLPEKIEYCAQCTISNQRPRSVVEFKNKDNQKKGIQFSKDRICEACVYNKKKDKIDWIDREKKLIRLLDKYRKNKGYDCIVPGSGGKDSAFASHILKYKYKMNPLTVTWAPHLYTDIGFENFTNWIHVGGLDNILFTPNGRVHKILTRLAFQNLLHPFQPFIVGQKIIGPLIASKFNIPLIFYGENQAEYGNALEENKNPEMNIDFFSTNEVDKIMLSGVTLKSIIKDYNLKINDFSCYIPPERESIKKLNIQQRFLGYYLKWDPQECYYYASKNTGFKPNTERTEGSYSKYSSIDDKIDPFHYYCTYIKFGIGRATYDSSQEVRNKKIDRVEGIELIKKYDSEFPKKYFSDFLKYININEKEFWSTIDNFRSPHLWGKKNEKWVIKKTIFK
jgi:N-acetyl sugar amidotransferase